MHGSETYKIDIPFEIQSVVIAASVTGWVNMGVVIMGPTIVAAVVKVLVYTEVVLNMPVEVLIIDVLTGVLRDALTEVAIDALASVIIGVGVNMLAGVMVAEVPLSSYSTNVPSGRVVDVSIETLAGVLVNAMIGFVPGIGVGVLVGVNVNTLEVMTTPASSEELSRWLMSVFDCARVLHAQMPSCHV